jgi:predicted nucleic acid-binding protein
MPLRYLHPRMNFIKKAVILADHLTAQGSRLITTRAVLLEIGNALAKQKYRQAAVGLLESLEQDPDVEIIPLTDALYAKGFAIYRQRPDKEWGITDCMSFVVMQERGLREALTGDEHFEQAGFTALLK